MAQHFRNSPDRISEDERRQYFLCLKDAKRLAPNSKTALGGHLRQCDDCSVLRYSYHSCRNRHYPKCHGDQTRLWLEQERTRLLPCSYFLLTCTLPAELRGVARTHQKIVYNILMRSAARALLKPASDPRCLGARPGIIAVLHSR